MIPQTERDTTHRKRKTDRQKKGQTGTQENRKTYIQADRQTKRQTINYVLLLVVGSIA
jgi:hypothetical protein